MMDHAAAHERIADLALEPTALATALDADASRDRELIAHVSTCERCQADIAAWRRVHESLGRSLRTSAPGARADVEPIEAGDVIRRRILNAARAERTPQPAAERTRRVGLGTGGPRISQTILGLAAALVVAVAGTLLLAGPGTDLAHQLDDARQLRTAVAAVDRILATPEHQVVALKNASGVSAGSVAWSSQDLVVLTSAIQAPPAGSVYRCWLVGLDKEAVIGQMDFAGDTAFWVGSLDDWASISLRPGWSFYVTLESGPAGAHRAGPVVLEAEFGSST